MPQDSVATVKNFWREVWKQPQKPHAIDRLVHEDFVMTCGGQDIVGREAAYHLRRRFAPLRAVRRISFVRYRLKSNSTQTR